MDEANDSISEWFGRLKAGEAEAAQKLWNHYHAELLGHAKHRIATSPQAMGDEEDVVASVFGSIWRGAAAGRFANITNRDELWWLLLGITKRKAVDHVRRETAQRRYRGTEAGGRQDEVLAGVPVYSFDDLVAATPTPEFMVSLQEQYLRLLSLLRDDQLRKVVDLRIEGHTVVEIAKALGIGERAIERKLQLIREKWKRELFKLDNEP
jgi:DNA-directed RNA polymerase specialized sigma24 family protein